MEERRPNLVRALNSINDFYMELKWDFQSWGKSFYVVIESTLKTDEKIEDIYIYFLQNEKKVP